MFWTDAWQKTQDDCFWHYVCKNIYLCSRKVLLQYLLKFTQHLSSWRLKCYYIIKEIQWQRQKKYCSGTLCIIWKINEAWPLKKDLLTFSRLLKLLKLKKNSITILPLLKFLILKKDTIAVLTFLIPKKDSVTFLWLLKFFMVLVTGDYCLLLLIPTFSMNDFRMSFQFACSKRKWQNHNRSQLSNCPKSSCH